MKNPLVINKATTPEDFEKRMAGLKEKNKNYEERAHESMEALMCRVLVELGFQGGVKIFRDMDKRYE